MLPDFLALGVAEDLVTGQSLPVLFDLVAYPSVWGSRWDTLLLIPLILLGGGVSFAICREYARRRALLVSRKICCPWDTAAAVAVSAVKTWLSATMLFRLTRSLDPDVGVRLCVIPFLCLLCMQWGDPVTYRSRIHVVLLVGTAAVLMYITISAATHSELSFEDRPRSDASLWEIASASLWVSIDAAFAGGDASGPATLVRLFLLCVLATCRGSIVARLLGEGPITRIHLFLYGVLLLLTCGLHAAQVRGGLTRIGARRPTRGNILVTGLVLLCALEFDWTAPTRRAASYVSFAVTLVRCARVMLFMRDTDAG